MSTDIDTGVCCILLPLITRCCLVTAQSYFVCHLLKLFHVDSIIIHIQIHSDNSPFPTLYNSVFNFSCFISH